MKTSYKRDFHTFMYSVQANNPILTISDNSIYYEALPPSYIIIASALFSHNLNIFPLQYETRFYTSIEQNVYRLTYFEFKNLYGGNGNSLCYRSIFFIMQPPFLKYITYSSKFNECIL